MADWICHSFKKNLLDSLFKKVIFIKKTTNFPCSSCPLRVNLSCCGLQVKNRNFRIHIPTCQQYSFQTEHNVAYVHYHCFNDEEITAKKILMYTLFVLYTAYTSSNNNHPVLSFFIFVFHSNTPPQSQRLHKNVLNCQSILWVHSYISLQKIKAVGTLLFFPLRV